jgi:hypothetical protein
MPLRFRSRASQPTTSLSGCSEMPMVLRWQLPPKQGSRAEQVVFPTSAAWGGDHALSQPSLTIRRCYAKGVSFSTRLYREQAIETAPRLACVDLAMTEG